MLWLAHQGLFKHTRTRPDVAAIGTKGPARAFIPGDILWEFDGARQEKIRRALQNNIKGGIVKEQEGVRNRVRCRRARVCVRQREKDPSLMIFFANDEVPRAILSFESVYQRHAEVKEVQRGVIIFFP